MTTAKSGRQASVKSISGVSVPDTKLAQEITKFIRDTETELLFPRVDPKQTHCRTKPIEDGEAEVMLR
jgi:hypothetical protein